jgi:hypothetical protein
MHGSLNITSDLLASEGSVTSPVRMPWRFW